MRNSGFFLRETVVKAMESRKFGELFSSSFEDPKVLRIHMMQDRKGLVLSNGGVEDGSTVERVLNREALEESVVLSELGESDQSIFRGIRPDFPQVENIGIFLMRDKSGSPVSTVTTVRNLEAGIVGVWNMATHPDKRGNKYGSRLLGIALSQPDFRKATTIHLLSMPGAVGFYEKQGFVKTERAIFTG